jgi:hypothetical protein
MTLRLVAVAAWWQARSRTGDERTLPALAAGTRLIYHEEDCSR